MAEGPPEENRELLRQFITEVTMLLKPAMDAAAAQMPGAPPPVAEPTAAAAGAPPMGLA
jgi:hypothetical protein